MCCGKENKTPIRYNAGEMNRQVVISYPAVNQPYFYSTKQGGGNGIEFEAASNFDSSNLDDSLLHSMGKFSSADGDEQEYEDEEYTEYENEEAEYESEGGDDITAAELPKFRELVRNKKLELKAQYGKAKISVFECGIKPLNPDLAHPNVPCIWDCSKSKHTNKDCCAKNRQQAQKRADQRVRIANWEKCRSENKGVIVWGWRKRWRDFKRAGGLAQLRMLSKGLTPPSNPLLDTPVVASQPQSVQPPKQVTNNVPVAKTPKKNAPNMIKSDKFTTATSNKTLDNLVKSQKKDSPISDSKVNDNVDKKDSNDGWSTKKKVIVGVSVIAALGTIFGILKWKKVI